MNAADVMGVVLNVVRDNTQYESPTNDLFNILAFNRRQPSHCFCLSFVQTACAGGNRRGQRAV